MLYTELIGADHERFLGYWRDLSAPIHLNASAHNGYDGTAANEENEHSKLQSSVPDWQKPNSFECVGPKKPRDYSFVIVEKGEPIFGCRLALTIQPDGKSRLGCAHGLVSTYFNRGVLNAQSHNFSSEALQQISNHLQLLIARLEPDVIEFKDSLNFGLLSPLSQALILAGGSPLVSSYSVVDLKESARVRMRGLASADRCRLQQAQRNYEFLVSSSTTLPLKMKDSEENSPRAEGAGSFQVDVLENSKVIATGLFNCSGKDCELVELKTITKPVTTTLILGLLWRAGLYSRKAGCESLKLDHKFQELGGNQLSFKHLGGVEATEMTVTKYSNNHK